MKVVPQADSQYLPVVVGDQNSTPFSQETVTISKAEYIELKAAAGYWKGMHARAQKQIDELKGQVEHWKGKFRKFKQRLFGKKKDSRSNAFFRPIGAIIRPYRGSDRVKTRVNTVSEAGG